MINIGQFYNYLQFSHPDFILNGYYQFLINILLFSVK